jgi:hypothetical protein
MRLFLLVLGLMLPSGFGGCMDSSENLGIPAPRLGDWFRYVGEGGGTLTATISSIENRRDGFLQSHESLIAELRYSTGSQSFDFEEAIALSDRRVVQQSADCGAIEAESESQWHCADDRATVHFSASGLPGAFGTSPFWGGKIPKASLALPIDTPETSGGLLNLQLIDQAHQDSGCATFAASRQGPIPRALPWTLSGGGQFTICAGISFPTHFVIPFAPSVPVTERLVNFTLQDHGSGNGDAVVFPEESLSRSNVGPVAPLPEPRYLGNNDANLPFEPSQAHLAARNLSAEYRARSDDGQLVVSFSHTCCGEVDTLDGVQNVRTATASLVIVDAQGNGLQVVLEKRMTTVGFVPLPPDYSLVDTRAASLGKSHAPLASQATLSAFVSRLPEIGWAEMEWIGVDLSVDPAFRPEWARRAHLEAKSSGYEMVILARPPTATDGSGLTVYAPYMAAMDGTTGSFLWFDIQSDELPF